MSHKQHKRRQNCKQKRKYINKNKIVIYLLLSFHFCFVRQVRRHFRVIAYLPPTYRFAPHTHRDISLSLSTHRIFRFAWSLPVGRHKLLFIGDIPMYATQS